MIDTEKIPLTEADTAAYDSTAQILKAAMAYVNPSIGRMMAVMAKSIELRQIESEVRLSFRSGRCQCLRCEQPRNSAGRSYPGFEKVLRGKGKRAAGPLSEYDEYGENV